jgi:hypothetical protein
MAFNICTDGESNDDVDVTSCGDDADVPDVIYQYIRTGVPPARVSNPKGARLSVTSP